MCHYCHLFVSSKVCNVHLSLVSHWEFSRPCKKPSKGIKIIKLQAKSRAIFDATHILPFINIHFLSSYRWRRQELKRSVTFSSQYWKIVRISLWSLEVASWNVVGIPCWLYEWQSVIERMITFCLLLELFESIVTKYNFRSKPTKCPVDHE